MRHRNAFRIAGLIFLSIAWCVSPGPLFAADETPAVTTDVRELVRAGIDLERSRKWIEAIEHYEKATKVNPDSRELEYGLRRSKIYFGVERRYSDKSFAQNLLRLSRAQSLALLDEILTKVQMHYVDDVSAWSFTAHGTESLYLALNDERFREANIPQRLRGRVDGVRQSLRQNYWNKEVVSREAARMLVIEICDLCHKQLEVPHAAVIMEYIFGGCNSLDDYSGYLTPSRLNDLYGNIDGQFVGLGIEMRAEAGKGMLLVHVLPESPAATGGLQPGDHIVSVNQRDCRNMSTDEAAGLLQGTEGSRVTLELQAEAGLRRVTLIRRAVVVKSIPIVKMVDPAAGIGYVKMTGFQKSSVEELDLALNSLRQQGMRALIWDLRGNPGGLLNVAVEVLDRFIPEGVLVSTKGRTADQNWSYTAHRSGTWSIPLVLLIDGDSASASEIVAGAVRDHQRGTIIGRKSYGKWSVQSIFPASEGTGLRLTTAKFYSPNGQTLGKIGVHPDIDLPAQEATPGGSRRAQIDLASDQDVQKGVSVLKGQLAQRGAAKRDP